MELLNIVKTIDSLRHLSRKIRRFQLQDLNIDIQGVYEEFFNAKYNPTKSPCLCNATLPGWNFAFSRVGASVIVFLFFSSERIELLQLQLQGQRHLRLGHHLVHLPHPGVRQRRHFGRHHRRQMLQNHR